MQRERESVCVCASIFVAQKSVVVARAPKNPFKIIVQKSSSNIKIWHRSPLSRTTSK